MASSSGLATGTSKFQYKQFFLFGDSITQGGWDQSRGFGFTAQLAADYARRLDVVNRGFSGYNTNQALAILPDIIPPATIAKIEYMTVFFGANDACLPEAPSKQGVSLPNFVANLRAVLTHPLILAHRPKIVVITTPPVDEHQLSIDDLLDGSGTTRSRCVEATLAYAKAARVLVGQLNDERELKSGEKNSIIIADLWATMMKRAGWVEGSSEEMPGKLAIPQNQAFKEFFYDGLHFNPAGYRVLYEVITETIKNNWPEALPENNKEIFPLWREWYIDAGLIAKIKAAQETDAKDPLA